MEMMKKCDFVQILTDFDGFGHESRIVQKRSRRRPEEVQKRSRSGPEPLSLGTSGVTLASSEGYFWYHMKVMWGSSGVILGSSEGHFGIIGEFILVSSGDFRSSWGYLRIIKGSCGGRVRSCQFQIRETWNPICSHTKNWPHLNQFFLYFL